MPHLKRDAILTTNTSGLPVASIAADLPERSGGAGSERTSSIRRATCGWWRSFPRRKPTRGIAAVSHFADVLLGKEVVFARDTPNFIANRIGVFIMLESVASCRRRT